MQLAHFNSFFQLDRRSIVGHRTPSKITPVKQLSISPSQFLNSPNLSFDVSLTSTPVGDCRRSLQNDDETKAKDVDLLVTPNPTGVVTSNQEFNISDKERELCVTPPPYSTKLNNDPHTPTPFKEKVAELEMGVKPLVR